jgi:ankyrin repeat protein
MVFNEFFYFPKILGETCIHLAAYNTNKNIIELLVKSGADVNAQVIHLLLLNHFLC